MKSHTLEISHLLKSHTLTLGNVTNFIILLLYQLHFEENDQLGPVVRQTINANPGLTVNQSFNISCIKLFFNAFIL